jgi:GNAT superfamily N-acetyltransferase
MIIKNIEKKDFGKIQQFAMDGMHFDMYTDKKWELKFYTKYFWYLELNRASQVLAAYIGDRLAGVLLADMHGEPKTQRSAWRGFYVKLVEWAMRIGYKGAQGDYDAANREMLAVYKARQPVDGELNFLAVDPALNGQGIGSQLLAELERREKGKRIYLFTNTGNSFYFYERKGFERVDCRNIAIVMHGKSIPHDCYLYSKVLGGAPSSSAR